MKLINIKTTSVIFAMTSALLVSNQVSAQVLYSVSGNHEMIQDAKDLVLKCAVELVRSPKSVKDSSMNHNSVVGFESQCAELKLVNEHQAQVLLDGQWYTAEVQDSQDSDGGDLDDMALVDSQGQVVATRTNVAAYDSVVLALAGGNAKLNQKFVP